MQLYQSLFSLFSNSDRTESAPFHSALGLEFSKLPNIFMPTGKEGRPLST